MQRQLGMTAGLSPSELTDYSLRRIPEPLAPRARVFGIRERVDYRGAILGPLQEEDVRAAAAALRDTDVEAVAICFLWSFKNPGPRAPGRRNPPRGAPRRLHLHLQRPGPARRRVRAHRHHARERLPRAGDLALHGGARAAPGPAEPPAARLERERHERLRGRPRSRAHVALGPIGRRDRLAVPGRGARPQQRHHLRHGRHVDRRRADRERRRAGADRDRDRQIPPAAADGRRQGDRRRRRLDRPRRGGRLPAGGPPVRGRRAGPGVLRRRRHVPDGHRRRSPPRDPRSRRLPRRPHHARRSSGARCGQDARRRPARHRRHRCRGRHQADRRREDGRPAAHGHARARPRSA